MMTFRAVARTPKSRGFAPERRADFRERLYGHVGKFLFLRRWLRACFRRRTSASLSSAGSTRKSLQERSGAEEIRTPAPPPCKCDPTTPRASNPVGYRLGWCQDSTTDGAWDVETLRARPVLVYN